MRGKKKKPRTRSTSDEKITASVTREMALPRIVKSAKLDAEERSRIGRRKILVRPPKKASERASGIQIHIEKYGTGTPPVGNS
jgi:hypothetical protein